MQKLFENYIQSISSKFAYVETSEMGYRTDFEILIKEIFEELLSNVVYGALGSVPHFLNTIDEFYSTDYLS